MEDSIRQRINEILLYYDYDITINKFSDGNSALQNRLSRQLSRGSSITCDTICLILSRFPNVSAEWLLRGKGEMLIASSPNEKKEEEALAESLFRNVLVEFMSMVNKRLKSIDNNTQSSVDKLEGITDLLAELRKTA